MLAEKRILQWIYNTVKFGYKLAEKFGSNFRVLGGVDSPLDSPMPMDGVVSPSQHPQSSIGVSSSKLVTWISHQCLYTITPLRRTVSKNINSFKGSYIVSTVKILNRNHT